MKATSPISTKTTIQSSAVLIVGIAAACLSTIAGLLAALIGIQVVNEVNSTQILGCAYYQAGPCQAGVSRLYAQGNKYPGWVSGSCEQFDFCSSKSVSFSAKEGAYYGDCKKSGDGGKECDPCPPGKTRNADGECACPAGDKPCGDGCMPATDGFTCCGDTVCRANQTCESTFGQNYCKAKTCPEGKTQCGAGDDFSICCDEGKECGRLSLGMVLPTVPVCVDVLSGDCASGTTECGNPSGKAKVCCNDATHSCNTDHSGFPTCVAKQGSCQGETPDYCAGMANYDDLATCCAAGGCRIDPNGFPWCL